MNTKQRTIATYILVMGLAILGCGTSQLFVPTPTATASLTPVPSPTSTVIPSPTRPPLYTVGIFSLHGITSYGSYDLNFTVRDGGVIDSFQLKFDHSGGTCTLLKPSADTWTLDNDGHFSLFDGSNSISIKVNGKFATATLDVRSCQGSSVAFGGEFTLFGRPVSPYIDPEPGRYTGTNVSFNVRDSGDGGGTLDHFQMQIKSQCGDLIDLDEANSSIPPEYWILNGSEFTYSSAIQPFYDVSIQVVGKNATIVWMITCAWPNAGADSGSITDIQWAP
ncbi:MAG TPA: hypothetical protein VK249_23705 [Anaerolineales bacterium]|nr:hypothetical protein [Anaerolineales bacterium]